MKICSIVGIFQFQDDIKYAWKGLEKCMDLYGQIWLLWNLVIFPFKNRHGQIFLKIYLLFTTFLDFPIEQSWLVEMLVLKLFESF